MNFGINNGINAIDSAAVKEAASQIFANAQQKDIKTPEFKVDYTKFNRQSLGADLYANKLSIAEVQQISVRNAGLDLNFQQNQAIAASVQYLNKAAALANYGVPQQMDGKINIPSENKQQDLASREVVALPASSQTEESKDLNGDRRGSNPFQFISLTEEDEKDSQIVG